MKTVLDLIRKFDELNASKTREQDKFSLADEKRWEELKAMYDLLVFHSGLGRDEDGASFSEKEIRECLGDDSQLRVPVDAHAMIHHDGESFDASVVNLSRSGSFLACDTLVQAGERLVVYITGISEDDPGDVFELDAEVVWCAERGIPEARIRRGMGVRFVDVADETRERLGALVVHTIEKRLARLK